MDFLVGYIECKTVRIFFAREVKQRSEKRSEAGALRACETLTPHFTVFFFLIFWSLLSVLATRSYSSLASVARKHFMVQFRKANLEDKSLIIFFIGRDEVFAERGI